MSQRKDLYRLPTTVRELHSLAMERCDEALIEERLGNKVEAQKLYEQALSLERDAIMRIQHRQDREPTYSILQRSAQSIAGCLFAVAKSLEGDK